MQHAASTPIRLEQTFTESEPHHVTLGVTWLHLRRIPEQFATRIGANMGSDSRCLQPPNQNPTMWRSASHGYICAGYPSGLQRALVQTWVLIPVACPQSPNQNPAHGAFAPSCRFAQDSRAVCNAHWRKRTARTKCGSKFLIPALAFVTFQTSTQGGLSRAPAPAKILVARAGDS